MAEVTKSVHDILFELVDSAVTNFSAGFPSPTTSLSLDTRNSFQSPGASACMYDHGLGSLNGKPLKEVDPSQPFIEIRKNGEACTSGDTCSTPDQLNFSGAEPGFCGRFGYEEAWNPPRSGDHVGNGPCSPSPETSSSSPRCQNSNQIFTSLFYISVRHFHSRQFYPSNFVIVSLLLSSSYIFKRSRRLDK